MESHLPSLGKTRFAVLLFSDIVDSTDLKTRHGVPAYSVALRTHNGHFEQIARDCQGIRILQNMGDGYFAEAGGVAEAVKFALLFQHAMREGPWSEVTIATRVGIHVGEITALEAEGGSGIVAPAADLAARVMSLAIGGQILLTRFPFDEARHFIREHPTIAGREMPRLRWLAHGPYLLKGRDESLEIFEVGAEGLAPLVAPPDGEKAKRAIRPGDEETLGWRPAIGLEIPGRTGWHLTEQLGAGGFGEVWKGEHAKLHQLRAFKFCFDDERLRALKREVTLVRLLRTALGDRDDIVRLHELKLDAPPFYLESDLAPHGNLLQWAEKQGGLAAIPLAKRIGLVAHTAAALAAAHSIGVLHKDIKPTNILIFDGPGGEPHPRLVDFGIGTLADPAVLGLLGITAAGFTRATIQHSSGTPTYSPPEYLAGRPFTIQGDIYGLGVLLYQLITAKPLDPLAPGWERDIADPLLREDIATCVDGDPARRFPSAIDLAERLLALPARRQAQADEADRRKVEEQANRAAEALRLLAEEKVRREEAERLRAHAEAKERETLDANNRLTKLLNLASMADYAVAARRIQESKWHEGVALLARALDWEPSNRFAAARLWSTLTNEIHEMRNWPLRILHHGGRRLALAFSEAGAFVLTATQNDAAQIWDIASGKPIGIPLPHEDVVRDAAFNADGSLVATISGKCTVHCWRVATGELLATFKGHTDSIVSVAFSPRGTQIVTTSEDKTASIWEITTGKLQWRLAEHTGIVWEAHFSPDGSRLVTASDDASSKIWDTTTGKQLGKTHTHESAVWKAVFNSEGSQIVTVCLANSAQCWDVSTGEAIGKKLCHPDRVMNATFSPDGTRVATAGNDRSGRIWDAASGEQLTEPLRHQERVVSIAFNPDASKIVTTSEDCTARIWDAYSGQPVGVPLSHEAPVWKCAFSPDGSMLLTVDQQKSSRIWAIPMAIQCSEPLRHKARVWQVKFNSDESKILTASWDNTVRLWETATRKLLATPLFHDLCATNTVFSADCLKVLTTSWDMKAIIWDVLTGQPIATQLCHSKVIEDAAFSQDGARVVTASRDNTAQIWDACTGQPIGRTLQHSDKVIGVAFSYDGSKVITASQDRTARIWDGCSGMPLCLPLQHRAPVVKVVFSLDGTKAATVSRNASVRVWDACSGTPLGEPLRHNAAISDAQFSHDGSIIATSSRDRTARIWDATTGAPLSDPLRHETPVNTVVFSPDGAAILTTSEDRCARIWDVAAGKPLGEPFRGGAVGRDFGLPIISATFSSDSTKVITGGEDKTARIWEMASILSPPIPVEGWVREWLRAVAGYRFTEDGEIVPIPIGERMAILDIVHHGDDAWSRLSRWVATPAERRFIHPDSTRTLTEVAERERDFGTREGLGSSLRYDTQVPLTRLMLAGVLEAKDARKPVEHRSAALPAQAAFLRDYDLRHLPENPEVLARAIRLLHDQREGARALIALNRLAKISSEQALFLRSELGL